MKISSIHRDGIYRNLPLVIPSTGISRQTLKFTDRVITGAKVYNNTPIDLVMRQTTLDINLLTVLLLMFALILYISLSLYVLECPLGYFLNNCSTKCRAPTYGEECQSLCQCPNVDCHYATGCPQYVHISTGYQTRGNLCREECQYCNEKNTQQYVQN